MGVLDQREVGHPVGEVCVCVCVCGAELCLAIETGV